ncbi:hypothetical protein A2Z10_00280 [Candidatus Azambacteria bacterium RBG_16_47_10]|uniref:Uncharacterized protein n=1 Tax=Candidatus Azambacteria bacterium RBG_16_47_10 TaxID=1797292 RepID=A0A1F5B1H1_9BACT|nr:MAG: hypothetical protein A2Z10_00280 [Candidatus Azambacteria bacterium RBG_16_47_10]
MSGSHNHTSHKLCPSFLVAAVIFSVFTLTGIVSAAWVDAPNAPPNYGITGCTFPCLEEDFRPMNLGTTSQTKRASITADGFYDRQDPTYVIDPASSLISLNLAGHAVINSNASSIGAQLVVNNPKDTTKTGSTGDAIFAFANTTGAALFAEQADPTGYAVYASGTTSYFNSNVEIGSAMSPKQLCLGGVCQSSWPSAGSGTTNTITKWTASNTLGDSIITDNGTTVGIGGNLNVTGTANTCKAVPYVSPTYQIGHSPSADSGSETDLGASGYPRPNTTSPIICGANYYVMAVMDAAGHFGDPNNPPQEGIMLCCKNAD